MGLEEGDVGGCGAAVGGLGGGGLGWSFRERVLGGGQVVEDVGVGGVLFGEGGEEFEGGGVVPACRGLR